LPFLFINLLLLTSAFPQESLFEKLMVEKELNPQNYFEAKQSAIIQGLPVSIKLPDGILMDVLKKKTELCCTV